MKGKNFWKKCLLFDLCCLCLVLGLIFTGTGKGAEMKQSLAAAAEKLEKTRQASGPAQEDAGASERKKVALTFDCRSDGSFISVMHQNNIVFLYIFHNFLHNSGMILAGPVQSVHVPEHFHHIHNNLN